MEEVFSDLLGAGNIGWVGGVMFSEAWWVRKIVCLMGMVVSEVWWVRK